MSWNAVSKFETWDSGITRTSLVRFAMDERKFARRSGRLSGGLSIGLSRALMKSIWNLKVLVKEA